MRRVAMPARPDYGQDVPDTVNALALVGIAAQLGGAGLWLALRARNRRLAAMGALTHGNVRLSVGRDTTRDDIERFLRVLAEVVADLRAQVAL